MNTQDIRVDSVVDLPEVPATSTLFEMVYVYKDTVTDLIQITSQSDLQTHITSIEELGFVNYYDKSFYVLGITDQETLQSQIDKIGNQAFTIVFSNQAGSIAKDTEYTFEGLSVFNDVSTNPWLDEATKTLALKDRTVVYANEEQDDKAWYSITQLLNDVRGYPYLGQVINIDLPTQNSSYDKQQRDLLMNANLSFAIDTLQGVKCFDVYAGGVQMRAVLGLYIAQFEFNSIYEQYISAGTQYTDTAIGKVEASIASKAQYLNTIGVIGEYETQGLSTVSNQQDANKVKGVYVTANKTVAYEYDLSVIKYKIVGVI